MGYKRKEDISWEIYMKVHLYTKLVGMWLSLHRGYTVWLCGTAVLGRQPLRPADPCRTWSLVISPYWFSVALSPTFVRIPLHSMFGDPILKLRQITPTPWGIFAQLVKIDRALYRTRGFITAFTNSCHWTLSWVSLIHATLSPPLP